MARVRGTAGTTLGFVRAVNKWTLETEQRCTDAFREGTKDFFDELWNATPVDTGNLRNSLRAEKNGAAAFSMPSGPGDYNSSRSQAYMVLDSLELGDKVTLGYAATYARRLNYGFVGFDRLGRYFNQAGRFWIEAVGSRYRSIMRAAATRLRG
jgi:hypothetical protein